jgi:hypothetical protein
MPTTRIVRYYTITKANLTTLLLLPEAPIEWRWEGRGPLGILTTRRPDVPTPNNPAPNVTRVQERYILHRLEEIRAIAFPLISPSAIETMTLSFTTTDVQFNLSLEE